MSLKKGARMQLRFARRALKACLTLLTCARWLPSIHEDPELLEQVDRMRRRLHREYEHGFTQFFLTSRDDTSHAEPSREDRAA